MIFTIGEVLGAGIGAGAVAAGFAAWGGCPFDEVAVPAAVVTCALEGAGGDAAAQVSKAVGAWTAAGGPASVAASVTSWTAAGHPAAVLSGAVGFGAADLENAAEPVVNLALEFGLIPASSIGEANEALGAVLYDLGFYSAACPYLAAGVILPGSGNVPATYFD